MIWEQSTLTDQAWACLALQCTWKLTEVKIKSKANEDFSNPYLVKN